MKTYHKFLLLVLFSAFSVATFGQNKDDAAALLKEGIALHDAGKYPEAIAKYQEALKIDPENINAQYEMSFTMNVSGKTQEAIPYLEKLVAHKAMPEAFDLLGSIYDDTNQFDKAEACYRAGIAAFPKFQMLHFNLSLAYLRQKKHTEAESHAAEAIKLNPKHASSQRTYALAAYGLDKRGESLLAWCSFLLLEPQTKRSAEAYIFVRDILNNGIKKTGENSVTLTMSDKDINGPDLLLPVTVINAVADKKGLTKTDSLMLQLKRVFEISETFAGKKEDSFYKNYFSDYFKKLAATDNMEAFARLISLTASQEENLQWFKDNNIKLSALDAWVNVTKREF